MKRKLLALATVALLALGCASLSGAIRDAGDRVVDVVDAVADTLDNVGGAVTDVVSEAVDLVDSVTSDSEEE